MPLPSSIIVNSWELFASDLFYGNHCSIFHKPFLWLYVCPSFFSECHNCLHNLGKFDRSTVCFVLFVFISELAVTFVDFPSLTQFWLGETDEFFLQKYVLNLGIVCYWYSLFFPVHMKVVAKETSCDFF